MTAPVTPPPVWNVGRYRAADGVHPWPMATDEWMADCAGVGRVLASLGIARGERVLIASVLSEANTVWPLIVATMGTGAQHSCADATAADAFRACMFLRTLEYRAVLGVNEAMLDGDEGALIDLLRAVPVVAARPGAFERLTEAGLTPHRWLDVGPVLALEDAPGAGACFDPERWTVTSDGGELVVSSPVPRLTTFDGLRTGLRGEVHDGRIFLG